MTRQALHFGIAAIAVAAIASLGLWVSQEEQVSEGPARHVTVRDVSAGVRPVSASSATESTEPEGAAAAPVSNVHALTPLQERIQARLAELQSKHEDEQIQDLIEALASEVQVGDIAAVLKFLDEQPRSELIDVFRGHLLRRWAQFDPRSAAEAALVFDSSSGSRTVEGVLGVWSGQQLDQAIAWMRQLPEGHERWNALLTVASEAARTRPIDAIEIACELPESQERTDLLRHASAQWASSAPGDALKWTSEIQDDALRETLLASTITAIANSDPVGAATFAVKSMSPGRLKNDTLVSVVQRWAQRDPEGAAAWIAQMSGGDLRTASLENLISLWMDRDRNTAGMWINSLPTGAESDPAKRTYAEKLAPIVPASAIEWALSIGDLDLRQQELENIAEVWITNDRLAAANWIRQSPLSDAAKKRLMSPSTPSFIGSSASR